ncbi:SMP-30/gluconolactonase/LRE family protein [Streptomyces sp. 35G-GA-8]|uniref:SMP-30/gluconolactonase/LRE family protein n=1 Tax=Streptomyces sp. 35G-GA-8 TaxID=2939434 RepID=UPI00201EF51E|nr:SMP-30/gluconolactonase/LRE family protein [Streptomyces sp. 35G-GA-8]MCL7382110.1 SMP-30/gluconolactonase/LRE family protein [Streptomyces sp. 35G-GA-8]
MRRRPTRHLTVLTAIGALMLAGCGTTPGERDDPDDRGASGAGGNVVAREVMRLTTEHEETGMTLLEGPVFDEDGHLLVVDVTAPADEPKVLRVDVRKKTSRPFFTDERGAYTSAQFSPYDGRLYLTDFANGDIVSLDSDGGDRRTFFGGEVDGTRMHPDDIAFDQDGNLYISDSGTYGQENPEGRVIRIDRTGDHAAVLADELASANGISFDADYDGLWFSELTENRISYLLLDGDGKVASRHTAIHVNGGTAQTDSIAVDADGNLYQGLHGRPGIVVYSASGELLTTVDVPSARAEGLTSATNVAITPGGTKAYMTVSGPAGGYLYAFDALAEGIRQSNGG